MVPGYADRLALHRAGKADVERIRGKFQRQLPRRALERNPVLIAGRSPREDHSMEERLQTTQTPLIPGQSHPAGICNEIETGNQGRIRPQNHRRILPKAGGRSGLRSPATQHGDCSPEPSLVRRHSLKSNASRVPVSRFDYRLVQPQSLGLASVQQHGWERCLARRRIVERLWRSLKYEYVYSNAFETGSQMRAGIGNWLSHYNSERPHSRHGLLTSDEAHYSKTKTIRIAA